MLQRVGCSGSDLRCTQIPLISDLMIIKILPYAHRQKKSVWDLDSVWAYARNSTRESARRNNQVPLVIRFQPSLWPHPGKVPYQMILQLTIQTGMLLKIRLEKHEHIRAVLRKWERGVVPVISSYEDMGQFSLLQVEHRLRLLQLWLTAAPGPQA